jgi:hypothetical protein
LRERRSEIERSEQAGGEHPQRVGAAAVATRPLLLMK